MRKLLAISTCIAAAAAAAPAAAQGASQPSPLIDALVKCKAEADETARLRCYDVAVGALAEASSSGEVVLVDREDVRKTRRSLFGFNLPKLPFFGGDDSEEDEADEVEVTIRSFRGDGTGKYVLNFDDGSTWQTTEVKNIRPKAGEKVTIKKAAMGSYFLRFGGRSARGMRIK